MILVLLGSNTFFKIILVTVVKTEMAKKLIKIHKYIARYNCSPYVIL